MRYDTESLLIDLTVSSVSPAETCGIIYHMSILGNIYKKISDTVSAKSYLGLISGNLPASTRWGDSDFLRALDISLYTDRAISKRAEKVGEVEWVVKDRNGEPILGHKLIDVLNYPNEFFSGPQFWKLAQTYYDVLGSVYIVKDVGRELFESSRVKALHLLRPDLVTPAFSADKSEILRYEYQVEGGGKITYDARQVIWIYNPDPKNPLQGRSLLKSGIQTIQTEVQISAYHSRVLENGGKVEGVFKVKTPRLTEQQLKELKAQYHKEYADARKAGTPLFLGGDTEYVRTGLTPDELSYLEAKKLTLEDIVMMTGVPKPLLGSFDDIQYSNADAAIRIFLRETIKPLITNLATSLDRTLVGDMETLTFVDPTPENLDDKLKETEAGIRSHFMTVNEARRRHNLEEVPEGDVIMVPFNLLPLGTPSRITPPADGEKSIQVKSTKEIEHPLRDPERRKAYGEMRVKKEDARIDRFEPEVVRYFNDQRDRLIKSIDTRKSFKVKGLIDETFNIQVEAKLAKSSLLPILTELLIEAGEDAVAFAESTYSFNVTADVRSWMDNRAEEFTRTINETTYKKLATEFALSFETGETRDELIERIRNVYDNQISTGRAASIARTEVHSASQYGTLQGYKQAGLETKIWVSVIDPFTRGADITDEADHISLDGEEVPVDMPFSNGLMFPGDPKGGPAETINCRCQA